LSDAELVERLLKLGRQELIDNLGNRFECQTGSCQIHLARGPYDVGLFAGVHHQRLAVDADHGLEQ
jgi:hypothetical protein